MEALTGGQFLYSGDGLNAGDAKMTAIGFGSTLDFSNGDYASDVYKFLIVNEGTIVAAQGGTVAFDITPVDVSGAEEGGVENVGGDIAAGIPPVRRYSFSTLRLAAARLQPTSRLLELAA